MARSRPARDKLLLDAVEAMPIISFSGTVWRVVRVDRDPLTCSAAGGRWDDQTFDVLYTSTKADGAVAELYYHLTAGQPVPPSKAHYKLYDLRVSLTACMPIRSLGDLTALGVRTNSFGQLSYAERQQEYPRSQEVAEAAYFLGRDGMIIPSARGEHPNLVLFCDHVRPECLEVIGDQGRIDWAAWRRSPFSY
jgi:RES domain-containing protein